MTEPDPLRPFAERPLPPDALRRGRSGALAVADEGDPMRLVSVSSDEPTASEVLAEYAHPRRRS